MPDWIAQLWDGYMPHGYCLRWNIPLLFVFILGNAGIAIAYFLIPLALYRFIGKRRDLPYPHLFRLFAAFILSCGLTHLAKIWTLYQPGYWVEAALDLWTAGVSLATAAILYPLIPQALQLRSPKELEEANRKLDEARLEAEKARDEAIQANKLKSEFVAVISHEIRTPLSSVISMSELLMLAPHGEDAPELSAMVFKSSKSLLSVLNNLLDFSKLEAGRVALDVEKFSVKNLFAEVAELMDADCKAKGLAFERTIDDRISAQLEGDETKIKQVLVNLANNAIKFTQSGVVRIAAEVLSVENESVTIRFSVTDTGIGISSEVQSLLFEPFVQADASVTRKYGGTGLGLAIAKHYVELMHGQIGVESQLTKGSTFWFTACLKR